ncbi:GNAT family N-acetyltransferase [Chitinolyticbacter meiyuanensis]|uniref:GNAT family N-acetyltransferase n=1 Tax=Chitinolyticbacter meiyuanensis TaxID=682798 RepID=UPI0011E5FFD4|nr:GNAT family N-acetyltransferase [Chitinolyticbacter meiyuanensis]
MFVATNDLVIRPFEEGDVDSFVAAARESVSTVGAWMPWCTTAYSPNEAKSWFDLCTKNIRANVAYDVGIFCASSGLLVGGVSINQINRQHNFGNIGYWVRQSHQKKGFASRAVLAIAQFGFTELKLTRLEIVAAVNNVPSRQVAEKVGASFECIARNRLIVFGKPCDAAVYSLVPT